MDPIPYTVAKLTVLIGEISSRTPQETFFGILPISKNRSKNKILGIFECFQVTVINFTAREMPEIYLQNMIR